MTGAQTLKYQRIWATQRRTQRYVMESNVSTACSYCLKIVPQAALHVPQENCMSDYKVDC